jgi:hypothetical protein
MRKGTTRELIKKDKRIFLKPEKLTRRTEKKLFLRSEKPSRDNEL